MHSECFDALDFDGGVNAGKLVDECLEGTAGSDDLRHGLLTGEQKLATWARSVLLNDERQVLPAREKLLALELVVQQ